MPTRRPLAQAFAFVLAAVVTVAMLAGIDGLASRDAAPNAAQLVQQQPAPVGG